MSGPRGVEQWIEEAGHALDREGSTDWDDTRRLAEAVAIRLWNYLSEGLIPSPLDTNPDVERLTKAMEIARTYISSGGHGHGPREMQRWGVRVEQAAEIAAIYERLGDVDVPR